MNYTTGNLARKMEVATEVTVKKRIRPRKAPFLNYKLLCIVVVCFAVAMFIQLRDGKIYEMKREIQAQQQTLFRLEAKNKQESIDVEKKLDLKEIENVAATRLNMHKPAKNQVVYLEVTKPDVGEVIKTKKDTGLFTYIMSSVGGIMEYLQ